MRLTLLMIVVGLHVISLSVAQSTTSVKKDSTNAAATFLREWEKDLLDVGVSISKDSFHVNEEVRRLMLDSQYRQSTYPATYNWALAIELMNKMELKKAFWHMVKLYQTDTARKTLVLQTFVLYDSLVDMEKILTNSFYTYALTDPEVCVIKNGKPNVQRPDIVEKNLGTVKEIIQIVKINRKQTAKN
jgi:hypothetical protein